MPGQQQQEDASLLAPKQIEVQINVQRPFVEKGTKKSGHESTPLGPGDNGHSKNFFLQIPTLNQENKNITATGVRPNEDYNCLQSFLSYIGLHEANWDPENLPG